MVLIFNISKKINLGNLHPIAVGKLLTKNFEGVIFIVPREFAKLKSDF